MITISPDWRPTDEKPTVRCRSVTVAQMRAHIRHLCKANRIEMRLGSIETTLSNQLVATLREYATQALAQHKIGRER